MQFLILIFLMMHLSQGADMVTVSPEDPEEAVRFLIWFRNETTLSVLGQGNTSASVDTRYKISIDPPDAEQNEVYVDESTGKLKMVCKKKTKFKLCIYNLFKIYDMIT